MEEKNKKKKPKVIKANTVEGKKKYEERAKRLVAEQKAGLKSEKQSATKMGYVMKMGSKQKHDPNNFSQKDQNKMATIPGAGERRVVGGSGFIGYLGGGAAKLGMKIAARLTGHKAVKAGGKVYGYEKGGKMTNTFKGLFNKSAKDKPAYGIDQYSYAKSKGRSAVETIKKGYPSVDPNLLKKYPTGPKLHKFHKDQAKKFMNKK